MGTAVKQGFVSAAESFSPWLAGFLLIIALIILAKDIYKNRNTSPKIKQRKRKSPVKAPWDEESSITSASSLSTKSKVIESDSVIKAADRKPTAWSLELLQSIEWKRFEELCAAVFNEINLLARNTPLGADGGIDIELYDKKSPETLVAIAQCKAWSKPVGVKGIREFYGVMVVAKVSSAYFVTTSSFTEDAMKFSRKSEVTLIDGLTLLKLIKSRLQDQIDALFKLATEGDYRTPTCPACGQKLLTRKASKTGDEFWGCRSYPRCKGKLNMKKGSST